MTKYCDCNGIVPIELCPDCRTCKDIEIKIESKIYSVNVTTCSGCSQDSFSYTDISFNCDPVHPDEQIREAALVTLNQNKNLLISNCHCN